MAKSYGSKTGDNKASKTVDGKLDDVLEEALECFKLAHDAEAENRERGLDDLRFARQGEQWPTGIKDRRNQEQRPCLTINKLPAFIRQVVNDARQNKPSIKVLPVDSGADPQTAEVINGLIRNIEAASPADVAYDTGTECATTMGFGYFRIDIEFAHDDSFDKDIRINRIANPLSVYGDPKSTAADSSDWNTAFVAELIQRDEFGARYKGADQVDWQGSYDGLRTPWREDDDILIAEYWKREEVERRLLMLSDGKVHAEDVFLKVHEETGMSLADIAQSEGAMVIGERMTTSHKVTQYILSGAEVLETNEWAGRYIPIIPIYGDEVNVEGKRHLYSMIHHAKGAQQNFNFWRTAAAELVALAPRVPFIGEKGAFDEDPNWVTANSESHAYLEYAVGKDAPKRQPLDSGPAAGALQESLNASDDMKSIIGLHDASLGARSNETSGRAIVARQREGDVSTFHFQDNMVRAIRHAGRVLIDLIPHVYSGARIVRVLGEDGSARNVPVNQPHAMDEATGEPLPLPEGTPEDQAAGIYDLAAGKYDLTVSAGPSYSTQREEARLEMTELIRTAPAVLPVIGDLLAKNFDWPQADDIAERLKIWQQSQMPTGEDPEKAAMVAEMQKLSKELEDLKADRTLEEQKAQNDHTIKQDELRIRDYESETKRMEAETKRDQAGLEPKTGPLAGAQISIPDAVGGAMAEAVGNALAQGLTLNQPDPTPMRRVPVRDNHGNILYADEVPIPPEELQGPVN